MPEKKDGQFYIIDRVGKYKFIEVVFKGEEDKPLYKIYDGKEKVLSWRSTEDLHNLGNDRYIADSDDYGKFRDWIEENTDEPIENDLWGLPVQSILGTTKSPNYKQPKHPRYDPYGSDDDYSSYGGISSNPKYHSWYDYKPEPEVVNQKKVDELTKSDTIVFHLDDPSTVMLKQIYEGKGYDEVHHRLNSPTVAALMDAHERIICLGHGNGYGLIGMFDTSVRSHFQGKKIFTIWCNADTYFNDGHVGQGAFITGNMPSEVWECRAAGCGNISRELMLENITYWSKLCTDKVEDCLTGNVRESVDYIRREYIKKYGDHPITHYNSVRTFVLGDTYEQAEKEVSAIEDELGIHPDWNKYNHYEVPSNHTYNTVTKEPTKTGNKQMDAGLDKCVDIISKQIDAVNGPTEFDLKKVGQGDDNMYQFIGKAVIERLEPSYPELKFTLTGSVISWKAV